MRAKVLAQPNNLECFYVILSCLSRRFCHEKYLFLKPPPRSLQSWGRLCLSVGGFASQQCFLIRLCGSIAMVPACKVPGLGRRQSGNGTQNSLPPPVCIEDSRAKSPGL